MRLLLEQYGTYENAEKIGTLVSLYAPDPNRIVRRVVLSREEIREKYNFYADMHKFKGVDPNGQPIYEPAEVIKVYMVTDKMLNWRGEMGRTTNWGSIRVPFGDLIRYQSMLKAFVAHHRLSYGETYELRSSMGKGLKPPIYTKSSAEYWISAIDEAIEVLS